MWSAGSRDAIRHGPRSEPWLYLSFDDGPDPQFTPRVMEILDAFGIPATFFVLGESCARHPQLIARLLDAGHQVGTHAFSHRHPWSLSSSTARDEVRRGYEAVRAAGGATPRLFRPPFGRGRPAMSRAARGLGLTTVMWSRSAIDWGRWGTTRGIARRLAKARPGDILLLHDAPREQNRTEAMLEVLPGFVEGCLARGWQFGGIERLQGSNPGSGEP